MILPSPADSCERRPTTDVRDSAIEALRWISIVAVVLHHGISLQRQSPETVSQILEFKHWIEWCVPAFFYVSGRLFRSAPLTGLPRTLASRARRLLVPYLAVSLVSFAVLSALQRSQLWAGSSADEVRIGAFLEKIVWLAGFGPQLYFLPYLFIVGALTSMLALLLPTRWLSTVAGAIVLVVGFGWMFPDTVLGSGLERLAIFLYCYCLGASDRALTALPARLHLGATFLLAAALGLSLASLWPLSLAVPPLAYRALKRIPTAPAIRFLERFGNPSGIFLWHAPILLPGASVALGLLNVRDWPNYLASAFLACIASLVVDRIVAKLPYLRAVRL